MIAFFVVENGGGPFSMHAPLSEIGDTIHRFFVVENLVVLV